MEINLITHNIGKVKEFRHILEPQVKVNHLEIEYPEIQSDDPVEIGKVAALQLAELIKKPIVLEDSGLFIDCLNGFPGTYSAPIHKKIGLQGLIKIMRGDKKRDASYVSAVVYCKPKKQPIAFLGKEDGTISTRIKGSYGFGHDPLFIPHRSTRTYAQMKDFKERKKFRKIAILKLLKYLQR